MKNRIQRNDRGQVVIGALLVFVVILAAVIAFNAWIFMLLLGTLHANVSLAVPTVAFGKAIAPAFLLTLLVGSSAGTGSSANK